MNRIVLAIVVLAIILFSVNAEAMKIEMRNGSGEVYIGRAIWFSHPIFFGYPVPIGVAEIKTSTNWLKNIFKPNKFVLTDEFPPGDYGFQFVNKASNKMYLARFKVTEKFKKVVATIRNGKLTVKFIKFSQPNPPKTCNGNR